MMTTRRAAVAALAVVFVIAAGCTPYSPGVPALTSPYNGSSVKDLFGDTQIANVQFCSPAGGPVDVTVRFANADLNTGLGVHASVQRGGEFVTLFQVEMEQGATALNEFTSLVPLEPGECTTVRIGSRQYHYDPGRPFTFTIEW